MKVNFFCFLILNGLFSLLHGYDRGYHDFPGYPRRTPTPDFYRSQSPAFSRHYGCLEACVTVDGAQSPSARYGKTGDFVKKVTPPLTYEACTVTVDGLPSPSARKEAGGFFVRAVTGALAVTAKKPKSFSEENSDDTVSTSLSVSPAARSSSDTQPDEPFYCG